MICFTHHQPSSVTLQIYSSFAESGVSRYGMADLDKPVKSLGPDFYVELSLQVCAATVICVGFRVQ